MTPSSSSSSDLRAVLFDSGGVLMQPSGRLVISDESSELRFVQPEEIEQLRVHHTQGLRLQHFLEQREKPYLG